MRIRLAIRALLGKLKDVERLETELEVTQFHLDSFQGTCAAQTIQELRLTTRLRAFDALAERLRQLEREWRAPNITEPETEESCCSTCTAQRLRQCADELAKVMNSDE